MDMGQASDPVGHTINGWKETARQYAKGCDYYRGLLEGIGKILGLVAYSDDEGNHCTEVLCAKLPELVAKRLEYHNALEAAIGYELVGGVGGYKHIDLPKMAKDLYDRVEELEEENQKLRKPDKTTGDTMELTGLSITLTAGRKYHVSLGVADLGTFAVTDGGVLKVTDIGMAIQQHKFESKEVPLPPPPSGCLKYSDRTKKMFADSVAYWIGSQEKDPIEKDLVQREGMTPEELKQETWRDRSPLL